MSDIRLSADDSGRLALLAGRPGHNVSSEIRLQSSGIAIPVWMPQARYVRAGSLISSGHVANGTQNVATVTWTRAQLAAWFRGLGFAVVADTEPATYQPRELYLSSAWSVTTAAVVATEWDVRVEAQLQLGSDFMPIWRERQSNRISSASRVQQTSAPGNRIPLPLRQSFNLVDFPAGATLGSVVTDEVDLVALRLTVVAVGGTATWEQLGVTLLANY